MFEAQGTACALKSERDLPLELINGPAVAQRPAPPKPQVEQARTWEHWANTIGAEPAVLREDSLDAIVARPITTRDTLIQVAREVATYDRDSVIEGWLPLLAMLYRNANLHFWWD